MRHRKPQPPTAAAQCLDLVAHLEGTGDLGNDTIAGFFAPDRPGNAYEEFRRAFNGSLLVEGPQETMVCLISAVNELVKPRW